jgi:hypothetical protein
MERLGADLISILQFLLPGFLAAWIYYGLTPGPKPSQFERVIEALILTLIVQVTTVAVRASLMWIGQFWSVGQWGEDYELTASTVLALLLGITLAYCANTDRLHAVCRKLGLTRQTSYPSEWFTVFTNNVTWVVLHFGDGRRIYGWPREWPSSPKVGHFALEQAEWLTEDADENRYPLKGVKTILVRADDVVFVEFMQFEVTKNGKEAVQSAAPDAAQISGQH